MRKAVVTLVAFFLAFNGVAFADSGTLLHGTLSAGISSATARVGDPVVVTNVHDDSGGITGTLYGHVTQVQAASAGTQAQLVFVLDRLSTNSSTYSVTAVPKGIVPPGVSVGKENTKIIASALLGALAGKLLGHTTSAMLIGAAAGAGAGFLLRSKNHQNIVLQPGSTVSLLLTSVTRLQARQ